MVDAIVSFSVQKIGDYLIQEAALLRGVKSEVEWLKNELEWMQCFLKDAEQKQDGDDNRVGKWVSEIRDAAYDIEDVLDTSILKDEEGGTPKRGFFASIKKYSCILNKEADLYSLGKEIQRLKTRILDISRKREDYGIQNINDPRGATSSTLGKLRHLRRASSFAAEEKVVGLEDDANRVLAKLLNGESHRYVISIFGTGGLGKTALAKKLYHSSDVKQRFHRCAWVSVSQEYRTRDLLQRIIKSFKTLRKEELEMLEKMNEEDLERYLHELLGGTPYLVVIDDVWDKDAWESLKRAFPDNKNGSRVIITTRIKSVAERIDERTYVHELRFLRLDESWRLFCEKAFRNCDVVDEELVKLGKEMVRKCGGLPLAIIVLGGLLFEKKLHEWHKVREHIWQHLSNDSLHISNLLALSFNDLPNQLKLCFLYVSLFPEDFEINAEKLIQLFVAEGFIPDDNDEIMEEVSKGNLNELIDRSLIQKEKTSRGRILTCRVHDLLRDLAVKKAKELNFAHVYNEIRNSDPSPSCRRQAVHFDGSERYLSIQLKINQRMRSLLFFKQYGSEQAIEINKYCRTIHKRFWLLRVLDLEGFVFPYSKSGSKRLPEALGELTHLRYLGLKNTDIDELPASIFNLHSLQTLDALGNGVFRQSIDICKFKSLRHLIGNFEGPLLIKDLTKLQTLKYVTFENWSQINPEKLINLQELRMAVLTEEVNVSFDSFIKLKSLQLLSVRLLAHNCSFSTLELFSCCQNLLQLQLGGKIEQLPREMHALLPKLECLALDSSELEEDPLPTLEKLPNLLILDLNQGSFRGNKMICTAKGFPKLELLQLYANELKELQVEDGAMPFLRGLKIKYPSNELIIPERLQSIPPPDEGELEGAVAFYA